MTDKLNATLEAQRATPVGSSAVLDDGEKRKGNTGVWTFVLKTPEGKILARSEWGTNYEFHEKQWLELPVVESSNESSSATGTVAGQPKPK